MTDTEREARGEAAHARERSSHANAVGSDGRYADLLRRRADVHSAAREPRPYYGDDDIDLLRSMLDEARAEIAQLEKQLADIVLEKKAEIRRLRDAIVSARWRLAKGRAIWNGPSIECDAALERGLTGADIRERASKLELAALDAPRGRGMTHEPIARLAAASEGSRELDAEICWLVEPHPQGSAGPEWRLLPQGTQQHVPTVSPHYTTSLDAAVTLVPEGCASWELDWNGHSGGYCATIYLAGSSKQHNGAASAAALAFCIAALKAREAKP